MRLNIQGWDSLALDGMPLDRDVHTDAVFTKHLGALRVGKLSELGLFWISSGAKRARPSRVLDVRYYPKRRIAKCRAMLAPSAASAASRTKQYLRDMGRLTGEMLAMIAARLAEHDVVFDTVRVAIAIARDLERLGQRTAKRKRRAK